MIAIAFIGTIQHDVSKDAIRMLISKIKEEASSDLLIVCNADGLFSSSTRLVEQLEMLFDSGIDLILVGEQAISRNCCRSVFAKTDWPIIKALNLPGSTTETSIKLINYKNESFYFISTAGQNGRIPVEFSYIKLDEFFQNKKDTSPVIIIESNANTKYLQALAWRYSNSNDVTLLFGVGTGFVTTPSYCFSEKSLFQSDIGSIVTENTVNGIEPELWWKKNIDRRPLTLLPKWGALKCDYTIVYFEEGKIKNFFTKSVRI